jgi:outer membrane protein assembly factor BamB
MIRRLAIRALAVTAALAGVTAIGGDAHHQSAIHRPSLQAGGLVARWDRDLAMDAVGYDPGSHTLALTGATTGIGAVDAHTGLTRWQRLVDASWIVRSGRLTLLAPGVALATTEPAGGAGDDRTVMAVGLADGVVRWLSEVPDDADIVVADDTLLATGSRQVSALGARDGKARWQWQIPGACHSGLSVGGLPAVAVMGCGGALYLVSLANGATVGRWAAERGCAVHATATSPLMVAAVVACSRKTFLEVIDPAARTLRWRRQIDPESSAVPDQVHVTGPVIVVDGADSLTAFNLDGTVLLDRTDASCAEPCLNLSGRTAIIETDNHPGGPSLTAVDAASGRTMWRHDIPPGTVALRDGLAYVGGDLPGPLWSSVLDVVDVATGRHSATPLLHGTRLVDVDRDGTMFLEYPSLADGEVQHRLAAMTATNETTGAPVGAPYDRWPDACRLIAPASVAALVPGATYTAAPDPITVGPRVAHTARCRVLPDQSADPVVVVSIIWTGINARQAHDVASQMATMADGLLPGVGDLAMRLRVSAPEGVQETRVLVQAGGRVGELDVFGDEPLALALARDLAEGLRRG